jgi:DeoR family ulaG and ulaABCDEF operon transcriptional repressor
VITDTGASDKAVQLLEQYGVKVVTVEPEALPTAERHRRFRPAVRPMQSAALYQTEASH